MEATNDRGNPGSGMRFFDYSSPRRYLVASDPHCFEEERNRYSNTELVEMVEDIARQYRCDELVLPGDVGGFEDVEMFLDTGVDVVRAAPGNHDVWEAGDPGLQEYDDTTLAYSKRGEWIDDSPHGFRLKLVHDPDDMGFRARRRRAKNEEIDPYDIILHGHSHLVNIRRLNDDTIGVASGSIQKESHYRKGVGLPERSVIVMEIDGVVDFRQIDFDYYAPGTHSDRDSPVVERVTYTHGPDGFEKIRHEKSWEGDIKFITG